MLGRGRLGRSIGGCLERGGCQDRYRGWVGGPLAAACGGSPPMLCLPSSLNELLLLFAPCFTKPTFQVFRALVVGQVAQNRLRCVTGMLVGARLSETWHHARAHRFFSLARWSVDELGLRVAEVIVQRLLGAD